MNGCISQECICACFLCRYWEKVGVGKGGWLAFKRDYSLQPISGGVDKSIPGPCRDVRVRVFICTQIRVTVFCVSVLRSVVFLSPGRWFGFLARSSAPPSVVIADLSLHCLKKNQGCTGAAAHRLKSFFILQMAGLSSSLVWWLERPLTCTRPPV